mmetsp:Transcript_6078/g.12942  ORF Transcript_6078/g.12942 Transcript_6078/m.12942 type:complete len:223 (-) Transcript_6078:805-1473(-)
MSTRTASRGLVIGNVWGAYLAKLSQEPLLTKSVSAGVLSIVSDVLSKLLSKQKIKSSSIFNELTMGLVIRGPLIHWFHLFLDRVVFRKARNQFAPAVVIGKLVLDQFVFSPLFISLYFILNALMLDQPVSDAIKKIRKTLVSVLVKNWSVWIPANAISYAVIPLNLRVLYGNIVSIFWTAYLIKHVGGDTECASSSKLSNHAARNNGTTAKESSDSASAQDQ